MSRPRCITPPDGDAVCPQKAAHLMHVHEQSGHLPGEGKMKSVGKVRQQGWSHRFLSRRLGLTTPDGVWRPVFAAISTDKPIVSARASRAHPLSCIKPVCLEPFSNRGRRTVRK